MLVNIQFLRFVAAMLVVFYHTSDQIRAVGVDQGMFFAVSEAVGFAGVDIFFVISGFIMAHTSRSSAGGKASWSFARRRIARIYSGYWPFFVLALLVFYWADPARISEASLLRSAMLWPANSLLLAVSWTLVFEMFFYVLFTLIILSTEQNRIALLKALLLFIVAWSVFSEFGRHAYAPGQLEYISLAEYYLLSPYLAEFLGGALLAGWLAKHPAGHGWAWLGCGISLFLLAGWINDVQFDGRIEQGYYVFYRVLAFGIPSVMILAGMVRIENSGFKAPLTFSIWVGGASYAIYLSHTLLLTAAQKLGLNVTAAEYGALTTQIVFFGFAVAILGFSVAHYRVMERPLHSRFKSFLRLS